MDTHLNLPVAAIFSCQCRNTASWCRKPALQEGHA